MCAMWYCKRCNYGMGVLTLKTAQVNHDCPNCKASPLRDYYAPGSYAHYHILLGIPDAAYKQFQQVKDKHYQEPPPWPREKDRVDLGLSPSTKVKEL